MKPQRLKNYGELKLSMITKNKQQQTAFINVHDCFHKTKNKNTLGSIFLLLFAATLLLRYLSLCVFQEHPNDHLHISASNSSFCIFSFGTFKIISFHSNYRAYILYRCIFCISMPCNFFGVPKSCKWDVCSFVFGGGGTYHHWTYYWSYCFSLFFASWSSPPCTTSLSLKYTKG